VIKTEARRAFLGVTLALVFLNVSCTSRRSRPDQNGKEATPEGGGMADGGIMDRMPDWMMSGGMMDPEMMRDMRVIHDLLVKHEKIQRAVEDIPGGIRAVTTSVDPEVASRIRAHVWQMKGRIEQGRPIRMMDPLFREIFRHHERIKLEVVEVPGGAQVTETSGDPQVMLLIQQHARRAVSEFVAGGMQRAMRPTPLPDGYDPAR
jgi:hypothetical protein